MPAEWHKVTRVHNTCFSSSCIWNLVLPLNLWPWMSSSSLQGLSFLVCLMGTRDSNMGDKFCLITSVTINKIIYLESIILRVYASVPVCSLHFRLLFEAVCGHSNVMSHTSMHSLPPVQNSFSHFLFQRSEVYEIPGGMVTFTFYVVASSCRV